MAARKILIFLIILLALGCGEDDMAQDILDRPIDPNTTSGSELADALSGLAKFQDSILSNHAGTSRPSYADGTNGGLIWIDFASFPIVYEKLWTGVDDVVLRAVDFSGPIVLDNVAVWVTGRDYPIGEYAIGSDFNLYRGLVTPNVGNDPVSSPTQWKQQTGRLDTTTDVLVADSADANCNLTIDGSDAGTSVVNVESVEDQNGNLELKVQTYPIGDWDMDATLTKLVAVSASLDADKIVSITVMIRDDNGATADSFSLSTNVGGQIAGLWSYDSGNNQMVLQRYPGGFFDSILFDLTSYNRGWVHITYYE